jgi:hypothetical protein
MFVGMSLAIKHFTLHLEHSVMAISLKKSETVKLTRDVALQHRDMTPSPTEREFDAKRVKFLRGKIVEGLFLPPSWAVAEFKGKLVRMNGQHSSHALCDSNGDFPKGITAHVDTYAATDADDLAMLFRQFDARQSCRSSLDIAGAYQGLFDGLENVNRKHALQAVKGISWYLRTIDGEAAPTGDDIGKMFSNNSYHGFICWCETVFTSKCLEMQRDQVVAAMYGTYILSESRARTFWSNVAKGGVDEGSVEGMLSEQLTSDRDEKDSRKKLKAAQVYGICAKAWNCFSEGTLPKGRFQHPKGKPFPELVA